jgi:hypothetical protein
LPKEAHDLEPFTRACFCNTHIFCIGFHKGLKGRFSI